MKEIALTNEEKLRLLKKTKEVYVQQYLEYVIQYQKSVCQDNEPPGLCGCFYNACKECGYFVDDSRFQISNIIPEWNRSVAYLINEFDHRKCQVYSSLEHGYWFPGWDNVSRLYFLHWLISKYTEKSTEVH